MNISYLVTCHEATDALKILLHSIQSHKKSTDELIILHDDFQETLVPGDISMLDGYRSGRYDNVKVFHKKFNKDYSDHKNYGNSKCKGDWIFQIDADESAYHLCSDNLHDIIDAAESQGFEMLYVPRMNCFNGVTPEIAKQWNWSLSESTSLPYNVINGVKMDRTLVNWPDYQSRIYKNKKEIKWSGRLHEKIIGYTNYSFLPLLEEYALLHVKSIEKQIQTNLMYNQDFSKKENMGHIIK